MILCYESWFCSPVSGASRSYHPTCWWMGFAWVVQVPTKNNSWNFPAVIFRGFRGKREALLRFGRGLYFEYIWIRNLDRFCLEGVLVKLCGEDNRSGQLKICEHIGSIQKSQKVSHTAVLHHGSKLMERLPGAGKPYTRHALVKEGHGDGRITSMGRCRDDAYLLQLRILVFCLVLMSQSMTSFCGFWWCWTRVNVPDRSRYHFCSKGSLDSFIVRVGSNKVWLLPPSTVPHGFRELWCIHNFSGFFVPETFHVQQPSYSKWHPKWLTPRLMIGIYWTEWIFMLQTECCLGNESISHQTEKGTSSTQKYLWEGIC